MVFLLGWLARIAQEVAGRCRRRPFRAEVPPSFGSPKKEGSLRNNRFNRRCGCSGGGCRGGGGALGYTKCHFPVTRKRQLCDPSSASLLLLRGFSLRPKTGARPFSLSLSLSVASSPPSPAFLQQRRKLRLAAGEPEKERERERDGQRKTRGAPTPGKVSSPPPPLGGLRSSWLPPSLPAPSSPLQSERFAGFLNGIYFDFSPQLKHHERPSPTGLRGGAAPRGPEPAPALICIAS